MKHPVGQTHNGSAVVVDLIHSPAAKRIAQQPQLLGYAKELLRSKILNDTEATIEHDLGRSIGYSSVVTTANDDAVFYAQLMRDPTYTRFVKKPNSLNHTQYMTVILTRIDEDTYEIEDIWIGRFHPPRPGTTGETAESKSYWENHAFVFDNQSLQPRSVTKVSPY